MKKTLLRETAALTICLTMTLAGCYLAAWLLQPPRDEFGSAWSRYLQEEPNSIDILFFGSSLVYCDVNPRAIWNASRLTSYVMAGSEQTIPITYYYIKEACKTQSPSLIAVDLTGMFYQRYQNYTQLNIGYMPWSENRLQATFKAAEPELLPELLFPLYLYHTRWQSVTPADLIDRLSPTRDKNCGYTRVTGCVNAYKEFDRPFTSESQTYVENLEYLRKISDFCKERDINLFLYISPSMGRIPASDLAILERDAVAVTPDGYMNMNNIIPQLSLNDNQYWYDTLHLNEKGAVKFSAFLANYFIKTGIAVAK